MKQYHLKSKISEESFAKFVASSLEEAIEYFSRLKKLSKKDLLNIYTVTCLLYTSPSPRDRQKSRMPSSA